MDVSFSNSFKRAFRKRIKGTGYEVLFWEILDLFIKNPFDERLRTHKLSGKLKSLWGFSIDYNLRIMFFFTKDKPTKAVLVDIGTHDEVY